MRPRSSLEVGFRQRAFPLLTCAVFVCLANGAQAADAELQPFFNRNCNDCHANGVAEGGLDLPKLGADLQDEATFARWERIYDRVQNGEMPPQDAKRPSPRERKLFTQTLRGKLVDAHAASKGTVLRRLNRREYQNTLNDIFGTNLDLAGMLPEDGKSHEFDNIGAALGLSMVHLQRYMDAVGKVLDTAIASTTTAPEPQQISASYLKTREAEQFLGKVWKKLDDGAVVQFSGGVYPSGMLRGTGVREPGRYRIRVTGYAYQSDDPITFFVGGTSFARGSEKPIYGFWSFPAGKPGSADKPGQTNTIEFETWIEKNYMVTIEPYGISDPERYKRKSILDYQGPGLAILNVTLEGPLVDEWPSRGHRLVFDGLDRREKQPRNPADKRKRWYKPTFEILSADENADMHKVVARVAAAAFRRPVTNEDTSHYARLFAQERAAGNSFEQALRTTVTAIFCSPKFLYLQESPGKLDGFALANRLSYFLSRTAPDNELLALAETGQLTTEAGLRQQTERLLESRHFERFLVDFTDNWLDLRDIDFTAPDRKLFPEFDAYLRYSMPLETRGFLRELIESNLPIASLIKSDFAMLNSRLASHYELPPVTGAVVRKVPLPADSIRGGILTQASILKVTANGTNTSPVTRGAWVMERIVGNPPPPPPPGIPGVEPDIRGASTLRQLLDKHRNLATCNACHQKIDPPGFALESFNPIGGFRQRYRSIGVGDRVAKQVNGRPVSYRLGAEVDSSGELAEAGTFNNFNEFREFLARDQRMLARTLAKKLLTFATGRELGFSDRDEIEKIVDASERNGFGVRDLVHLVVQSDVFKNK